MPRGPMLQFKINSYSLVKDVQKILKHPKTVGKDSPEFLNPPLLVLNGFSGKMSEAPPHEKLMVTVFQNMFPPIQPQSTRVTSIKRILMINKDPETQEISLRHYAIDTKLVDTSRNIKKLINSHHNLKKSLPIMTKNEDVSDLLLDPYSVGGMTSDSEVEDDAIVDINEENQASATKKVPDQQQPQEITRKKAIKLTELGPRINMSLVKIEEKLTGTSKTIYHSKIVKTPAELKNLEKSAGIKRKLKAERRAKQLENVQAKKDKKDEKKARKKARIADENGENRDIEQDQSSDSDSDSDGPDVDQYEIDSDLYS
ncbi:hypothetical protein CANTEDRAFT_119160, partial [Yamadazyma tenuis ATCC 10573]